MTLTAEARLNELLDRWHQFVTPGVKTSVSLFAERAEGPYVTAVDGRRYLDFAGGIGVLNVGHRPDPVLKAIRSQLDRYLHISPLVIMYEPYLALAERLAKILPQGLKQSIFVNSGAEAVENAVKIARAATKRRGIIAFQNAFHGRTFLTMSLTGKVEPYKAVFGALVPDIYHAPYPYVYRSPFDEPEQCAEYCLQQLEAVFHSDVAPRDVAAVVIEAVQGEGGFIVPPPSFLRGLREICNKHGILYIDDEVQAGLGRTGKWFAIEHAGVVPDLVVTAKAIGGGLPLGAVSGPPDVMSKLPPGALGSTFGGNPLSCVAGLVTLDLIEQILPNVARMEAVLRERLAHLAEERALIGEVRGKGAMQAIELVLDRENKTPAPEEAKAVQQACLEQGLLLLTAGWHDNVVRMLPPLNLPKETLEEGLTILEGAVHSVSS
jgi:4-aminobutyrate aminotransferase/(S)-3-amino-2-methylpropionate transaminase